MSDLVATIIGVTFGLVLIMGILANVLPERRRGSQS